VRGTSAKPASAAVEGLEDIEFEATAQPLGDKLIQALDEGLFEVPRAEERARILTDRYGWARAEGLRWWCFGPQDCGINAVLGPEPEPGTGSLESAAAEHARGELEEARGSIVAACRWATKEGALCEETVRGVRFAIRGTLPLPPGSLRRGAGAVVSAARRCLAGAQLGTEPGLLEPLLWVEVLCTSSSPVSSSSSAAEVRDAAAAAREVLEERGATILSEDAISCDGRARILAELSTVEVFGLEEVLADTVGRNCRMQAGFSRWAPLPGDPSDSSSRHRATVAALRRWRQLREDIPEPVDHLQRFQASLAQVLDDDLDDVVVRPQFSLQVPVIAR